MNYTYKEYDKTIDACMVNLWTASKNNHELKISNIDLKDKSQIAVLYITNYFSHIFNVSVITNLSFCQNLILRFKYKLHFNRVQYFGAEEVTYLKPMINFMEDERNEKGIFKEIYEYYYRRK